VLLASTRGSDNATGADNQQERLCDKSFVQKVSQRVLRDYTPSSPLGTLGEMR
jgi:hypothetical protein